MEMEQDQDSFPQLPEVLHGPSGLLALDLKPVVESFRKFQDLDSQNAYKAGIGLIRLLQIFNDAVDIEGFNRFESSGEAKRLKEDLNDIALEVFKIVANGTLGFKINSDQAQVAIEDRSLISTYRSIAKQLLERFNEGFAVIDGWSDSLLGVAGSGSARVKEKVFEKRELTSLCFVPFLRLVLTILFRNPFAMIDKSRENLQYSNDSVGIVSNFMKLLLNEISNSTSPFVALQLTALKEKLPLFGAEATVDAVNDARFHDELPVVQYVSEWVTKHLKTILWDSADPREMCMCVKDVMELTQHRCMAQCRIQISPLLLNKLLYLLSIPYARINPGNSPSLPGQFELITWAMLVVRYVHGSHDHGLQSGGLQKIYTQYLQLLKSVHDTVRSQLSQEGLRYSELTTLHAIEMRLLAEWSVLMLSSSLDEYHLGGSTDISTSCLGLFVNEPYFLTKVADITKPEAESHLLPSRLVTVLCRTSLHALRYGYAGVHNYLLRSQDSSRTSSESLLDMDSSANAHSGRSLDDRSIERRSTAVAFQDDLISNAAVDKLLRWKGVGGALEPVTVEAAIRYFVQMLQFSTMIAKNYLQCYSWPIHGLHSECAQESMTELLQFLCHLLFPVEDLTLLQRYIKQHEELQQYFRVCVQDVLNIMQSQLLGKVLPPSNRLSASTMSTAVDELPVSKHTAIHGGMTSRYLLTAVELFVSHMGFICSTAPNGGSDCIKQLQQFLRSLIYQSQHMSSYLQQLEVQSREGPIGGFLVAAAPEITIYQTEQLFAVDMLLAMAKNTMSYRGTKDFGVAASCLALLSSVQQDFYMSSKAVGERLGFNWDYTAETIGSANLLRLQLDSSVDQLRSLIPPSQYPSNLVTVKEVELRDCIAQLANASYAQLDFNALLQLNMHFLYEKQWLSGDNSLAASTTTSSPTKSLKKSESSPNPFGDDDGDEGFAPPSAPNADPFGMNDDFAPTVTTPTHPPPPAPSLLDFDFAPSAPASVAFIPSPVTPGESAKSTTTSGSSLLEGMATVGLDSTNYERTYSLFQLNEGDIFSTHSLVSPADIHAVIDDVVSSHLVAVENLDIMATCPQQLQPVDAFAKATCLSTDRLWTTVTGSADLVTVQVLTDCDKLRCDVDVHVRVHNSSAMRIDEFSLQLLFSSMSSISTRNAAGHRYTLSAKFTKSSIRAALGEEYFLPGAYIERKLSFHLTEFRPLDLMVRVVYPRLSIDTYDMFEVPANDDEAASVKSKTKRTANRSSFRSVGGIEAAVRYDSYGVPASASSNVWNAVVDTVPVRLPVTAMLQPYAQGMLSNLYYWRREHHAYMRDKETTRGGVPREVFQQLWQRLSHYAHSIAVKVHGCCAAAQLCADFWSYSAKLSREVTRCIIDSQNAMEREGSHSLGMDCRVAVNEGTLLRDTAVEPYVCWCFRTLWGNEMAAMLSFDPRASAGDVIGSGVVEAKGEESKHSMWTGRLEVRCADESVLAAILMDIDSFAQGISGGFVACSQL